MANTQKLYQAKKRAWKDVLTALERKDLLGIGWSLALASVAERECDFTVCLIMTHVTAESWNQAIACAQARVRRYEGVKSTRDSRAITQPYPTVKI